MFSTSSLNYNFWYLFTQLKKKKNGIFNLFALQWTGIHEYKQLFIGTVGLLHPAGKLNEAQVKEVDVIL